MLISCPECGRRISSTAEKCPGCDYPIGAILGNKIALAEANAKMKAEAQKKAQEEIEQERLRKGLCPKCEAPREFWERKTGGDLNTYTLIRCTKCGNHIRQEYSKPWISHTY